MGVFRRIYMLTFFSKAQSQMIDMVLYIPLNNIPQAVQFDLFLYGNDLGLAFQPKNVVEIERKVDKGFAMFF